MKLGVIVGANFKRAVEELARKPLKMKLAYQLTDLLEIVDKETVRFEKLRTDLVKRYGQLDDSGKPKLNEAQTEFIIQDREAFNREFEELLHIDIALPRFKVADFENIDISALTLLQLKPILE
jgi:hypothetical protein